MEKAKVIRVIKTESNRNYPYEQTITKYWSLDGELLFENVSGEMPVALTLSENPSFDS